MDYIESKIRHFFNNNLRKIYCYKDIYDVIYDNKIILLSLSKYGKGNCYISKYKNDIFFIKKINEAINEIIPEYISANIFISDKYIKIYLLLPINQQIKIIPENIPNEMYLEIIKYMDYKTLNNFSCTNKYHNNLFTNKFYQHLIRINFKLVCHTNYIPHNGYNYKYIYLTLLFFGNINIFRDYINKQDKQYLDKNCLKSLELIKYIYDFSFCIWNVLQIVIQSEDIDFIKFLLCNSKLEINNYGDDFECDILIDLLIEKDNKIMIKIFNDYIIDNNYVDKFQRLTKFFTEDQIIKFLNKENVTIKIKNIIIQHYILIDIDFLTLMKYIHIYKSYGS